MYKYEQKHYSKIKEREEDKNVNIYNVGYVTLNLLNKNNLLFKIIIACFCLL